MPRHDNEVTIEDAVIPPPPWRNFAGREDIYNREGDRNFVIFLTPEMAEILSKDGWNVKQTKPRGEDEFQQPYLEVKVKFGDFPPRIIMVTSGGRNQLGADLVEMLDAVDIETVDVTIRPYDWELKDGRTGRSAYLKIMYVKIVEEYLDVKWGAEYA